jgi:hypothetical protein
MDKEKKKKGGLQNSFYGASHLKWQKKKLPDL